jgi:hypothetical protein
MTLGINRIIELEDGDKEGDRDGEGELEMRMVNKGPGGGS